MCWVMPPASLLGDVRKADGIEQRSLTVIDVAHDGDHGRTAEQIGRFFGDLDILHRLFFVSNRRSGSAEFARDIGGELGVESLVDGGEDAAVDQLLDDEVGLHVELLGKLLDGDAFGDGDVAIDGRRRGGFAARLRPQHLLFGFAAAALRGTSAILVMLLRTARGLIGRRRRRARTDEPATRGGMHGTRDRRDAEARPGMRGTADLGPLCGRLAGARRTLIKRLAGTRRLGARRQPATRRRRLARHGRRAAGSLLQIGSRRHIGGGRLATTGRAGRLSGPRADGPEAMGCRDRRR